MTTKTTKIRTTMVIAAPNSRVEARLEQVGANAAKQKSKGGLRCELYVVVTDHPNEGIDARKKALKQLAANHWADKIMVVIPQDLRDLSQLSEQQRVHALADYIALQLIKRLIRTTGIQRKIGLVWDASWPIWSAAGSAVSAALIDVAWWKPPGAPWLSLLNHMPREEVVRPPSAIGDDAEDPLFGESESMVKVRALIRAFAKYPEPVLIIGETGTGKELCARQLHNLSNRKGGMSTLNGSLLDSALAESALFGHKKHAFTDAKADRTGRIKEAGEDGTFFLDEINSVPLKAQSKLLRALQDADDGVIHITPVGGDTSEKCAIRFISALQRDPFVSGELRPDLYFRIAGLTLEVPPLRERGDDVLLLSERFIKHMVDKHGEGPTRLDKTVKDLFKAYLWPGNVRELRFILRQAWVLAENRKAGAISQRDLPTRFTTKAQAEFNTQGTLKEQLARYTLASIDYATAMHPHNKAAAARYLGLNNGQEMERMREQHARKLNSLAEDKQP